MDKNRRDGIMEILDKYDESPRPIEKKLTKPKKKIIGKNGLLSKGVWGQVADTLKEQPKPVSIDIQKTGNQDGLNENPKE